MHPIGTPGHFHQLVAQIVVVVSSAVDSFRNALSIRVVGIRDAAALFFHAHKLPSMLPGVGPPVVCQRIADLIVSNGLTVVGCQQVLPLAVAIGISHLFGGSSQGVGCVGILGALENVAAAVVAIDPGFSGDGVICPCQPI